MTSEELNEYVPDTLMESLGIRFINDDHGRLGAIMPVDHRTLQPLGFLHGGASLALMETLGSAASFQLCQSGQMVFGIHLSANHLKSLQEGIVTAYCMPVSIGERLHIWDISIRDEEGNLISVGRLSNRIIPVEQ
jgi:1,4-dihydroxy-2-naphthoyl-CoA hydrolase